MKGFNNKIIGNAVKRKGNFQWEHTNYYELSFSIICAVAIAMDLYTPTNQLQSIDTNIIVIESRTFATSHSISFDLIANRTKNRNKNGI